MDGPPLIHKSEPLIDCKDMKTEALIALEDGRTFPCTSFTGPGETWGELVFNTGMTGYQEVLTDPSYRGQMVTMTYPLIGNYGVNPEDVESDRIQVAGFIVREYQEIPSNFRATATLADYLRSHGVMGIEGLDTRALTRKLRLSGAMKGILSTHPSKIDELLEKVRAYPGLVGRDLVREVSCDHPYLWKNGAVQASAIPKKKTAAQPRVVVLDCGVKYNILRLLEQNGCEVVVVPAASTGAQILSYAPDGVLLSNGPGDPSALPYIVEAARDIIGKMPVFGICLGHQIIGQAVGGATEKLKFGHHGINQPVKNLDTGRVEITSQNHGFVVVPESVEGKAQKSFTNLNDHTSEGMKLANAMSVQYHPEAAPGPRDTEYLFADFVARMKFSKENVL